MFEYVKINVMIHFGMLFVHVLFTVFSLEYDVNISVGQYDNQTVTRYTILYIKI